VRAIHVRAWRMDACCLKGEVSSQFSGVGKGKGSKEEVLSLSDSLSKVSAFREFTSEAGMAEMGLVMRRRRYRWNRLPFGFHAGEGAVIGVDGRETQWSRFLEKQTLELLRRLIGMLHFNYLEGSASTGTLSRMVRR
jgi:hypothetical protein